jgi:hypothetical protein
VRAAVDVQNLARDLPRVSQIQNGVDDVIATPQKALNEPGTNSLLRSCDDCSLLRWHVRSLRELNGYSRLSQRLGGKTIGQRYRRYLRMYFEVPFFFLS